MPTYDYRCEACGHTFELFQGIREGKRRKCPDCGKSALVRLFGTGAGVIFKGSGFYETDYKRNRGPAQGASEGAAHGGGDASPPKPAEGTSAAPSEKPAAKRKAGSKQAGGSA
jgi:putative FmdB family regulatory protein